MQVSTYKKYKTREGNAVRIYCTDAGGDYPVHGAVLIAGEWQIDHWARDGRTCVGSVADCEGDIVEVKERFCYGWAGVGQSLQGTWPRTESDATSDNRDTSESTNMEPDTSDAPLEAQEVEGFSSPVSIHVTSYRTRLCDIDGISAKAIIDGIVHCGILQDDSPKFVTEVSYSQKKVKNQSEEKTVVTITEVC